MIPTQTMENFPVFSNNGTRVQPDDAKYAAGFQESDVLPAEWLNWFFNKASNGVTIDSRGLRSVEIELNNILTAAGITPTEATQNQVLTAIEALCTAKTGTLANLTTTAKTNLVAAINEVKAQANTSASTLESHIANTNNPHSVGGSQLSDPVPVSKVAAETFAYARILYGECTTEAATQAKSVQIANLTTVAAGLKIDIKFTNGNTAGTCYGTSSNKIAQNAAPTLSINNGTAYPIKVAGEFAGEGFVAAGDIHTLIFDGTAWNDISAENIYYRNSVTSSITNVTRWRYSKNRNGILKQYILASISATTTRTITLPLPFTDTNYEITANARNTRSSSADWSINCGVISNTIQTIKIGNCATGTQSADVEITGY